MDNDKILEMMRDIVVSRMSNTTIMTSKEGGKEVAAFMQEIYDKLVELNIQNDPTD